MCTATSCSTLLLNSETTVSNHAPHLFCVLKQFCGVKNPIHANDSEPTALLGSNDLCSTCVSFRMRGRYMRFLSESGSRHLAAVIRDDFIRSVMTAFKCLNVFKNITCYNASTRCATGMSWCFVHVRILAEHRSGQFHGKPAGAMTFLLCAHVRMTRYPRTCNVMTTSI